MILLVFTSSLCLTCIQWIQKFEKIKPKNLKVIYIDIEDEEEDKNLRDFADSFFVSKIPHAIILQDDMHTELFNRSGYFDPIIIKEIVEKYDAT